MDSRKILLLSIVSAVAHAASDGTVTPVGVAVESGSRFSVYWQSTYLEQQSLGFRAPYAGPNSLSPRAGRETVDMTLYAGVRLWSDAELWVNPEGDQGFGLNNTLGVAGFPSGEAYKVGKNNPYFRLPRAFVRQTLNFGNATQEVESSVNQMSGYRSPERLVLTIGKFSVTDVFDTNQYAHDPRNDFLNWSVVDTGSFDYAADAWGYTVGAAAEWYQGLWTVRGGVFDLSDVPNSTRLEPGFHEFQLISELEKRHEIGGLGGKVLLTAFDSRGRMGLLDEALRQAQLTGSPVDITSVRHYRSRLGVSLSLEQQLFREGGMFVRIGKSQGNVEAYEFTDIDRTIAVGFFLHGSRWQRPLDSGGVALVQNGISGARERYLNAGGLGILVGDGLLPHPGPEQIIETYYDVSLFQHTQVSLDYQRVTNPGYNRDRGPVSLVGMRMHAQF